MFINSSIYRSIAKTTLATLLLSLGGVSIDRAAQADTLVMVRTSDNVSGAGTDSNVYLKIFGPNGESKRHRLQDLSSKSELFSTDNPLDVFLIPDEVGPAVTKVIIESDGRYPGSDWHLDSIETYTVENRDFNANILPIALLPQFALSGIKSTFRHEGWITGDENLPADSSGNRKLGIELLREEPVVTKAGSPELIETDIYSVGWSDALDSSTEAKRVEISTITRQNSLILTDLSSNRAAVGAEATVGYSQGEAGYNASLTLAAEYEYIKENTREQSFSSEASTETDNSFGAQPNTIQFRIASSTGRVTKQKYKSIVAEDSFLALYLENANPFDIREATFTKGELGDEEWNRSVGKAVAISRGKREYNNVVRRLKSFNILKNPLSFEQARAGVGERSGDNFAGTWNTDYGQMTLSMSNSQTSGTYTTDNGRIQGSVSGQTLNGYWIEDGSARKCSTAKQGSFHWGRIQYTLGSNGRKFNGQWSYCDDPITGSSGAWNGNQL